MNKNITSFIVICIAGLIIIASSTKASTIKHRYSISAPTITKQSNGFQLLSFTNCYQVGKIGEPTLPLIPIQILLPPGHTAREMKVVFKGRKKFADAILLPPKQYPRNELMPSSAHIQKSEIYSSEQIYTGPASEVETHFYYGHSVALSFFCPVEYIPSSGSVYFYSEAEVTIETAPDPKAEKSMNSFRLTPRTRHQLFHLVDNFHQTFKLYPNNTLEPVYDYLIITIEDFLPYYQPMVNFYNQRGIRTHLEKVEEIYKTAAGADEQEKIRNYIKNEIYSNGISCVLLAGDADIVDDIQLQVPIRNFYCEVLSGAQTYYGDIPSDLYYSALDGNWNNNGDDKWGEPGEDDLLPEIAVGRICADNSVEIAAHLNKIFAYQSTPVVGDARRMLLAGEKMWDNPLSYGAEYLDLLINNQDENGYFTVGMPADLDYIFLYEKTLGPWNGDDILQQINSGCNIIHHSGHSSTTSNMNLSVTQITDENFADCDGVKHLNPVVYSHGCYSASIDLQNYLGGDCIGETMLEIEKFASAYIGNSRYGWFNEGQTEGPSLHLHREFISAVYGDSIYTLGAAHAVSRFRTAPFVTAQNQWEPGALRWCFYGCNVLGDPQMALWTNTINTFSNLNHPTEIQSFPTTIPIATGVPRARVGLYSDGNLLSAGIADEFGDISLALNSPPSSSTIDVTVTALNYLPYTGTISSPMSDVASDDLKFTGFDLKKSYPNPFNMATLIQFSTSKESHVRLEIFNVMGQKIKILWAGHLEAGIHQQQWDASDETGSIVSNGIYFIRLNSTEGTKIQSCLLLK